MYCPTCPFADQKMVDLYEASAKNYPTNEEILTQLFMAYVRVGDYQKQQQVKFTCNSRAKGKLYYS